MAVPFLQFVEIEIWALPGPAIQLCWLVWSFRAGYPPRTRPSWADREALSLAGYNETTHNQYTVHMHTYCLYRQCMHDRHLHLVTTCLWTTPICPYLMPIFWITVSFDIQYSAAYHSHWLISKILITERSLSEQEKVFCHSISAVLLQQKLGLKKSKIRLKF